MIDWRVVVSTIIGDILFAVLILLAWGIGKL